MKKTQVNRSQLIREYLAATPGSKDMGPSAIAKNMNTMHNTDIFSGDLVNQVRQAMAGKKKTKSKKAAPATAAPATMVEKVVTKSSNKSQLIRKYKGANPSASPKEVAEALSKDGLQVSAQFVSTVLSNSKKKGGVIGKRGPKTGSKRAASVVAVKEAVLHMSTDGIPTLDPLKPKDCRMTLESITDPETLREAALSTLAMLGDTLRELHAKTVAIGYCRPFINHVLDGVQN